MQTQPRRAPSLRAIVVRAHTEDVGKTDGPSSEGLTRARRPMKGHAHTDADLPGQAHGPIGLLTTQAHDDKLPVIAGGKLAPVFGWQRMADRAAKGTDSPGIVRPRWC